MCCDGTFLDTIVIAPDEPAEEYRSAGLTLKPDVDGTSILKLPCNQLSGCECQTYACRPRKCQTFRCHLLRRQSAGEISLDQALEILQQAKDVRSKLRTALDAAFPELREIPLREALRRAFKPLDSEDENERETFRKKHAAILLVKRIFKLFMARQFFVDRDTATHSDAATLGFLRPNRPESDSGQSSSQTSR